ncbi:hypothetical protein [Streptomyces sp. NPDC051704]|uniref:hypothetical protein n=1 Tax=Streptomyces sp. NPDC051704 TaxID=3365671 RepID=UPI0037964AC1
MSRMAQAIVLARYEDEVMEPLTRPDEARTWHGCFVQIPWFVGCWHIEFERSNRRRGVLEDLESLPWNEPACVQVMLHDEDDDLFGLWMFRRGVLVEVVARDRRDRNEVRATAHADERVRTMPPRCFMARDGCVPAHVPIHPNGSSSLSSSSARPRLSNVPHAPHVALPADAPAVEIGHGFAAHEQTIESPPLRTMQR